MKNIKSSRISNNHKCLCLITELQRNEAEICRTDKNQEGTDGISNTPTRPTDVYRIVHPATVEHAPFSSAHKLFPQDR